jgi:ribonuclease HI
VADFLAEHSVNEAPIESIDIEPWNLYFDGSRHKHGTGIGIFILSPCKIPTKFKYKINGSCSNNEAEYEALITDLEILLDLGARHVKIRGDSELVIKQLTKEYKCIQEHLMKYFVIAFSLLKQFESYVIQHVPRIENQEANDLAQIASGYKISKDLFEEFIEVKDKLISNDSLGKKLSMPKHLGAEEHNFQENFENFEHFESSKLQDVDMHFESFVTEIFVIDNLSDTDWRKPIVNYLENPSGITDRKIKYKALSYTIIGNELFKKTPEGILLKCLSENETFLAITNVHSGSCGANQAGHKMKWLLFRRGFYWPSMLKDCIEFAKSCQECQRHAGIQHVPASELHSVIKPWPFRGWALDLIGEIRLTSSKNQRFILV